MCFLDPCLFRKKKSFVAPSNAYYVIIISRECLYPWMTGGRKGSFSTTTTPGEKKTEDKMIETAVNHLC